MMNNAQLIKDLASKRKWSTKVDHAIKTIKSDVKIDVKIVGIERLEVLIPCAAIPYQLKKIAHYVEILQQDLDRTFGGNTNEG